MSVRSFPVPSALPDGAHQSRRFSISMSTAIALAAVGMLLPFILLVTFGLRHWVDAETTASRQSVASNAEALAHALDRELKGYIDTAEVLAGSRHLKTGDLAVMEEIARDAAIKTNGNFVLFDRSYQQLFNTRSTLGSRLPVSNNTVVTAHVFATRQPVIADLSVGTLSGEMQFAVVVPVLSGGEARYALSYVPDQAGIHAILTQTFRPDLWMATIVDGTGRIVARSSRNDELFGTMASNRFKSQMAMPRGLVDSVDLDGRPSITAFESSRLSNWRTVVWAPREVLDAPRRRLFHMMLAMSSIALLLSIGSAFLLGRLIDRPAHTLVEASRAIGAGEVVSLEPMAIREADIVGRAIADASALIARRQRELRESEASLRLALSSAHAGAWEWSLSSDLLSGTPEFHRLFGNSANAASVPFETWLAAAVDAEDRERVSASIAAAVEGTLDRFAIEFRTNAPADEPARWIMTLGQIERRGDTASLVRGIAIDITERKRAEDHQRFLMRELSHRSKNLLSIVQAMANQTGRSSSTIDEFLERFRRRIAALAGAQDALIEQNWFGAHLADVARTQVATFIGARDNRVRIAGPEVFLDADAVQAIGLAMHELATNSVKYGALSAPEGRVEIEWRLDRTVAGERLHLSWTERGGPLVEAPTRKGFGHAVIVQMVAAKLDGEVTLDYPPQGLCWTLHMPAKHIAREPEPMLPA